MLLCCGITVVAAKLTCLLTCFGTSIQYSLLSINIMHNAPVSMHCTYLCSQAHKAKAQMEMKHMVKEGATDPTNNCRAIYHIILLQA